MSRPRKPELDAAEAGCFRFRETPAQTGPQLARRLRRQWGLIEVAANLVGAFVVFGFLHAVHAAQDPRHSAGDAMSATIELAAFLVLALPLGWAWRERRSRRLWGWLEDGRSPEPGERDLVLREPLREIVVPGAIWGAAAILFAAREGSVQGLLDVTLTIVLGGVTTCALIYLLVERLLRPLTARALADGPPERPVRPCVPVRLITAWALASGVPLLGLGLLAVRALAGEFHDAGSVATAMLVVAVTGLATGSIATVLSARSLAEPIDAVRRAIARLRSGDLTVEVPIDDGSEVGLLQAGFNEMAAGLREREHLRDLFGRHVGADVAHRALAEGVALGGEIRVVAALFVDLVGSTALAARRPPEEVVTLLNRFFAVVVDGVEECGGWVNRFEGDGALCVFGAPAQQPDAAGRALAAGRLLHERLRRELPYLEIGIGISAGPAVAGNVGAERRLEYTVIGDPVNEAARLCELAKRHPAQVLTSGAALARARPEEAVNWRLGEETTLRGRAAPTQLAIPVTAQARPREALLRADERGPTSLSRAS